MVSIELICCHLRCLASYAQLLVLVNRVGGHVNEQVVSLFLLLHSLLVSFLFYVLYLFFKVLNFVILIFYIIFKTLFIFTCAKLTKKSWLWVRSTPGSVGSSCPCSSTQ